MNKALKIVVVAGLILSVAAIVRIKQRGKETDAAPEPVNAGRRCHPSGSGPASPGGPGGGQVHPVQDDGPDPRRTEEAIQGQAGRGLHRRVEESECRQAVRHPS